MICVVSSWFHMTVVRDLDATPDCVVDFLVDKMTWAKERCCRIQAPLVALSIWLFHCCGSSRVSALAPGVRLSPLGRALVAGTDRLLTTTSLGFPRQTRFSSPFGEIPPLVFAPSFRDARKTKLRLSLRDEELFYTRIPSSLVGLRPRYWTQQRGTLPRQVKVSLLTSVEPLADVDEDEQVCDEDEETITDYSFDLPTTASLVATQSGLIVVALVGALALQTPNFGLGLGFSTSLASWQQGIFGVVPLVVLAVFLDLIEDRFVGLKDVSMATQRVCLTLMGGTFRPLIAVSVATTLGVIAGLGEEMLFRGVAQFELTTRLGSFFSQSAGVTSGAAAVYAAIPATILSSVVFGAIHAVTPWYAILAGLASCYFGFLFVISDYNLFVPIVTHSVYDIGALLVAHWTVTTQLSPEELDAVVVWEGPAAAGENVTSAIL
jgi:uncharacterized protein